MAFRKNDAQLDARFAEKCIARVSPIDAILKTARRPPICSTNMPSLLVSIAEVTVVQHAASATEGPQPDLDS